MLNVTCVLRESSSIFVPLINYQSVRWLRPKKPFWLGIAKSKMFVVPQSRITRTEEEIAELNGLKNNYNTQLKSLLKFIKKDNPLISYGEDEDSLGSIKQEELKKKKEESLIRNEKWNAVSVELREKRLQELVEKHAEEALIKMENMQKKDKERREKIEEAVKLEKEKSKSFITMDKLDEAIENCLRNVVEYNFAIDLRGQKYTGKDPIKVSSKEKKIVV